MLTKTATDIVPKLNVNLVMNFGYELYIYILYFFERASCNDSWYMTNVTHKFLSMFRFMGPCIVNVG